MHYLKEQTRKHFFGNCGVGLGSLALNQLLGTYSEAKHIPKIDPSNPMASRKAPLEAKAKNVIYLFMAGAPSHLELFDHKPKLNELDGQAPPPSLLEGRRFAFLKGNEKLLGSTRKFDRFGECGMTIGETMPHISKIVDEVTWLKGMTTDVFNHGPAKLFMNTGFQAPGRPSIGSWVSYGLGSMNRDLPAYVVMTSRGGSGDAQPLYSRLWSSGFLPTQHSGVKFRNTGDPVYYISNPDGINREMRRDMLDDVKQLNLHNFGVLNDPQIKSRIAQYEMAFRMQSSVPELADISGEPEHVLNLYGPDVKKPGSFAANCLHARRLVERDVRFVQLFHMGWDHHSNLSRDLPKQSRDTDHPTAGLISDLKQRGLVDETLIIWGGEFGRTIYAQSPEKNGGRDHHPRCFSYMLAGGGVKAGFVYGETDDYSYNIVRDPVHVHDLNATILNQLGIDHESLVFKFQGRQYRLTDVHGRIIDGILT